MKKLVALFMCLSLLLVGCSPKQSTVTTIPPAYEEPNVQETIVESSAATESTAPVWEEYTELLAISLPATTEVFTADDGTEIFTYTAQQMQFIHPDEELADKVTTDFLNRVNTAKSSADSVLNSAKTDYLTAENWYPYFYQIIYSPMRIDQGVLSLFGSQNCYGGSYNSRLSCVAVNYDLSTGDILTLGSIMHVDATTDDFISIVIDKLNAMADELGLFEGFEDGVRNRLGGDENLYEDFFFTNTGLSFFFAPYEIAPYASGVITVEIPYEELPGLLYDGYFPAERELVEGTLKTGTFMETDMVQFHQLADVVIVDGEEIMVAYPDGMIEDVRVIIAGDNVTTPEYTVFAAERMSSQNAIVLSLPYEMVGHVTIQYSVNGTIESIPLT